MGFNVKELDNLSADEKVKVLMERLKEYEKLKCSEKNCDSDLSNGEWTIYKNRKLCSKCYKKEYDKDKQPDMNLIVDYYLKKMKSVSVINEAKSKINMTEEEFKLLIKPFKTAKIENLEYMRAIAEHYIIVRLAQGSINSLKKKHNMEPKEYEELIEPFKLEYESKPKKITISRSLDKQDNAQLNTQNTAQTVEDSALESENNTIEVHSIQKESLNQTQIQEEENTPINQSTPPPKKRNEESTSSKQNTPPMQQQKEEKTSGTQREMGKQEENENQHSSIDQEKEEIVAIKNPTSPRTKEPNLEEQHTNNQFVTKVDSEIVFGVNKQPYQIIDPDEKTRSSKKVKTESNEPSLFDEETSLFNTDTNLDNHEEKKPIPFTSFTGFGS
ncbi:hypothetical protein ABEX78_22725 [Priestia megaterium]